MQNERIIYKGSYIPVDLLEDRLKAEAYNKDYLNFKIHKTKSGVQYLPLSEFTIISAMVGWKGLTTEHYIDKGGFYLIRTVDLNGFFINLGNALHVEEVKVLEQPQIILKEEDIVISKDGTLGEVAIVQNLKGNKLCAASTLARIRKKSDSSIDSHYILVCLASTEVKGQIYSFTSGIAQPHLNQEYLKKIEIPIPSSEIQKYIGDKVRKAENLRLKSTDLVMEAEGLLKELLKYKSFESLYNNNAGNSSLEFKKSPVQSFIKPKDITSRLDAKSYHPEFFETIEYIKTNFSKTKKLKDIVEKYSSGYSGLKYSNSGIPIIMTKNVTNDMISLNDCKLIVRDYFNGKINLVEDKELLFTMYGGPSIGKVDIFINKADAIFDYTILKFKLKKDFNPFFMVLLLRSKLIQNQVRYLIKGTTGITFLLPSDVMGINVPSFELEDQIKIGQLYEEALSHRLISSFLIKSALKDVEDLIEGKFEMKNEYMNLINK